MKKNLLLLLLLLSTLPLLTAQDDNGDLLSILGEEPTTDLVRASFKTTRLINGHSIENTGPGVLDFKISHRFTALNFDTPGSIFYDWFGLDGATVRIGLDYGITDRLMVGIGRSSREKMVDGFAKYRILWQSTGKRVMPISLSYFADVEVRTLKFADPERKNYFSQRLYFAHQLLIARKFNERLTLQLMPTLIHRNLVPTSRDKNDVFAIGGAGRIKLTRRVTLNAEYYYVPEGQIVSQPYANSLAIGFDIETGGHVFQLHFTNAQDMVYKGFITETTQDWFPKGGGGATGIRFGFNISRVFTIVKPKGL